MRYCFVSIFITLLLPFVVKAQKTDYAGVYGQTQPEAGCVSPVGSPYSFALRSNGLLDVALIPNVTLEIAHGQFSGSVTWATAWWGGKGKCWRLYGGEGEWRYWFGKAFSREALTGHHAGVFVGLFTYDFKLGRVGRQCPDVAADWGVSYGYSFPVSSRLNLDFNIGVGFIHSHYKRYRYECGQHVCDGNRKLHYFGPVKAEVSLVWLLGDRKYK